MLTKENYPELDVTSRCFRRWKKLGPWPLDEVLANSEYELNCVNYPFKRFMNNAWG
jgi:hypothetical protein